MSEPSGKQRYFTYADYLTWPDEERWELIDGEAFSMSPAPTYRHQQAALEVGHQLSTQLKRNQCRPMIAPLDVRLTETDGFGKEITHVVQPDVLILCDASKADEKGLIGAPDWVLEILSDGTSWKDTTAKLNLYERFGVKEYWIFNPVTGLLLVYLLENGRYGLPSPYLGAVKVPLKTLPGLEIDLGEVLDGPEQSTPRPTD